MSPTIAARVGAMAGEKTWMQGVRNGLYRDAARRAPVRCHPLQFAGSTLDRTCSALAHRHYTRMSAVSIEPFFTGTCLMRKVSAGSHGACPKHLYAYFTLLKMPVEIAW